MLVPRRCPLCDEIAAAPCPGCLGTVRHAGMLPAPPGCDRFTAAFAYEGAIRSLLLALKYGNRRDAIPWLGAQLAAAAGGGPYVAVTWAPTSRRRAGRRGFDQAELLARAVARHVRSAARPFLRRGAGAAQTGRGAAQRRTGPRFQAMGPVPSGPLLLVDDVATTGATLGAAARALRAGGATAVHAVVVARTPRAGRCPRVAGWSANP